MVLETEAGSDLAMAFVSEAYHPWWRAEVDGEPAQVLRAQMTFMAVPVGPGAHVIDLRFERPGVVAAADRLTTAAWLTLAVALPAAAVVRRRRG